MTTYSNPPLLQPKQIVKAFIWAVLISIVILLTAVLPAEYGIDPVGAGKLLGFSKLYSPSDKNTGTPAPTTANSTTANSATTSIMVPSHPLLRLEDAGSGPHVPLPEEANNPAPAKQLDERQDSITIRIPAGKGLEYKMNLLKHGKVKYEWRTNQGVLFFDFHGEVKEVRPAKDVYFESYTAAYSNNVIGTFLAPFEGRHGWYFKNNDKTDIIVTLRLKGQYTL